MSNFLNESEMDFKLSWTDLGHDLDAHAGPLHLYDLFPKE